ncbi:MAG: PASTA domain-containing protein [Bacteroidaceae bacterium]|nr:PASTA domain-containing protein [Bacteroidaceae bacterium]
MFLLFIGLIVGAYFGLNTYTHHGEKIEVPNLKKVSIKAAKHELGRLGLTMVIADTLYLKNLPADIVLEQIPAPGKIVKGGRIIYLIVNAGVSPSKNIPDIIDNSSYREAIAKLKALGFKRIEVQYVAGEKDWLYAIKANGKFILNGEKMSVEAKLVLQVGDGTRDLGDSVTYTDPLYYYEEEEEDYTYSSHYDDDDNNTETNTDNENQNVEVNVDDEIERLIRERQAQENGVTANGGTGNNPNTSTPQ